MIRNIFYIQSLLESSKNNDIKLLEELILVKIRPSVINVASPILTKRYLGLTPYDDDTKNMIDLIKKLNHHIIGNYGLNSELAKKILKCNSLLLENLEDLKMEYKSKQMPIQGVDFITIMFQYMNSLLVSFGLNKYLKDLKEDPYLSSLINKYILKVDQKYIEINLDKLFNTFETYNIFRFVNELFTGILNVFLKNNIEKEDISPLLNTYNDVRKEISMRLYQGMISDAVNGNVF